MTKELIEEARDRAAHMKLLAKVTENSPGAIVALEEADRMTRFADALAARQPTEDDVLDHLALWRVMYVDESRDCDGFYPLGPFYVLASHEDEAWNFADAIPKQDWPHTTGVHEARYATDGEAAEWLASRSAVPDAATELAQARADLKTVGEVSRSTFDKLKAERDAALAAVARVTAERDSAMARIAKAWELHEPFTWSFGYGPVQTCKWCADHGVPQDVASWPCPTVAALDGAPEPETAPENYEPKCNCEHVKRHTSPPLPVEGESKP